MSAPALAWAQEQRVGNPTIKAVLIALADAHNRHEGHCFIRVRKIARDVEASERTVQRALKRLEELDLIRRVASWRANGSQECNSFVFPALGGDESAVAPRPPRKASGRGCQSVTPPEPAARPAHPPSDCHPTPRQPVTPSNLLPSNLFPPEELRSSTPSRRVTRPIPKAWTPPPAALLPPEAKACAERWPAGAYVAVAEAFQCYWAGEGGPRAYKRDWAKTWASHVVREDRRVMRDARTFSHSGGHGGGFARALMAEYFDRRDSDLG